ncbi:MAG TPA: response regulator [Rhizomicrobium sp.]|jgi:CheY-like chemotaxis protein|nr:response regulator [Rhizomicrobium sp.]
MPLVLIIDDDAQMRATMRRILTSAGHRVVEAADGREGLAAFQSHAPDVVVTDLVMPEKEGIETIIELRRANHRTRILAVSGSLVRGDLNFLAMAGELGADLVLEKPFRAAQLQEAVNSLAAAARPD